MTDRELMQQALEALSSMLTHMGMDEDDWNKPTFNQCRKAEAALRERLARQKQEPVAWMEAWYGSGPERGWWIVAGRDHIAYLGDQIESDEVSKIVAAHNITQQPVQKPVAWLCRDYYNTLKLVQIEPPPPLAFPVYTAPQPAQQPVAWICDRADGVRSLWWSKQQALQLNEGHNFTPLYTAPQPAQQPLTEEQIDEMWRQATIKPALTSEFVRAFARAIEAALGITGEKK